MLHIPRLGERPCLRGNFVPVALSVDDVIASWAPILDLRFNEVAGPVINYGSLGAAGNGVNTGCVVGQAGAEAAGESYLWNALGSYIQLTDNAAYDLSTGFSIIQLIKPTGLGESNAGCFFCFDYPTVARFDGILNRILFYVNGVTDAEVRGTFSSNISITEWTWMFWLFDGTWAYAYRSNGPVLEQLSYTTRTSIVTFVNPTVNPRIGNKTGTPSRTFAGYIDRTVLLNVKLTEDQMNELLAASPFLS